MLVTRKEGMLTLLTQPDHAAVAGQLAEAWGNEQFAAPEARDALLCAAAHHDDGWFELDGLPAFNEAERRPAHFTELPLTETVGPYGRGVESVYRRDLRAGVLVSMHWSGFSTSRWGAGGTWASDDPLAMEVVASQEARWTAAAREVWANQGRRSEFDAHTWHAYEVLQVVDLLSLACGQMDLEEPSDDEPRTVERTLSRLDQPPGPRTVATVPTGPASDVVDLHLGVIEPGALGLAPWPFSTESIQLVLPLRRIPDRAYASAQEAATVVRESPFVDRRAVIRPAPPAGGAWSG
jgi:hypothetical protein